MDRKDFRCPVHRQAASQQRRGGSSVVQGRKMRWRRPQNRVPNGIRRVNSAVNTRNASESTSCSSESLPAPDKRRLRILFAPTEICGQMQLLAEHFRQRGHEALAVNYGKPHRFAPPNDRNLGLTEKGKLPRFLHSLGFAMWAIPRFDVFHFFYGRSLVPAYLDLPILRLTRKKIIVHFRGSDLRSQRWLRNVVEPQLTGLSGDATVDRSTPRQLRRIAVWRRHADHILISIPELKEILPEARVFQQSIDIAKWSTVPAVKRVTQKEPVVIAHVASKRSYKGSDHVIRAVRQLQSEGLQVELDLVENVPPDEVRLRIANCDIGVDEVIQGSYGNVAIEMMATGRPVVARLCEWYRDERPDLPIVNADPLSLADKLRRLVVDLQYRLRLGDLGRPYVEKYHDVNRHVAELERLYGS